jgi:hypothetical protein
MCNWWVVTQYSAHEWQTMGGSGSAMGLGVQVMTYSVYAETARVVTAVKARK